MSMPGPSSGRTSPPAPGTGLPRSGRGGRNRTGAAVVMSHGGEPAPSPQTPSARWATKKPRSDDPGSISQQSPSRKAKCEPANPKCEPWARTRKNPVTLAISCAKPPRIRRPGREGPEATRGPAGPRHLSQRDGKMPDFPAFCRAQSSTFRAIKATSSRRPLRLLRRLLRQRFSRAFPSGPISLACSIG